MITEPQYRIQRIHSRMLLDWRKKLKQDRVSIWSLNLIAGLAFGLMIAGVLEFYLCLSGKTYSNTWLLYGAIVGVVLALALTILSSDSIPRPNYDDAKFIYENKGSGAHMKNIDNQLPAYDEGAEAYNS